MLQFKKEKIVMLSIILGLIFGLFAFVGSVEHLRQFMFGREDVIFNQSDILIANFLHRDFDQYEYLRKDDASILLSPIIFYFIGSTIAATNFLRKNKGHSQFIYARCQNHRHLSITLLGKNFSSIFAYTSAYFLSLFLGMNLIEVSFISSDLTLTAFELILFFFLRLLVINFLVFLLFVVFIKKEASIALILNMFVVMFILMFVIHLQLVNLAIFDDVVGLVRSIVLLLLLNMLMYIYIKFKMRYELP